MKIPKRINVKTIQIMDDKNKSGHNLDFQGLASQAMGSFNLKERIYSKDLFYEMNSLYHEEIDDNLFVHVVKYIPNDRAATVPSKDSLGEEKTSDLREVKAPSGEEYLQSESFLLLFKDFAFIVSNKMTNKDLSSYFEDLLTNKQKSIETTHKIIFRDIASMDAVSRMKKYGVKKIVLNTLCDKDTLNASSSDDIIDNVFDSARRVFFKDNPTYNDQYNIELAINKKGKLEESSEDILTETAISIYEGSNLDKNGYSIILNDGKGSIKEDEIKIHCDVYIKRDGNSLNRAEVLENLIEYKNELIRKGALDA